MKIFPSPTCPVRAPAEDRVDRLLDVGLVHAERQLHLLDQVRPQPLAAVDLDLAFLPAVALDRSRRVSR